MMCSSILIQALFLVEEIKTLKVRIQFSLGCLLAEEDLAWARLHKSSSTGEMQYQSFAIVMSGSFIAV